jgi:hypothetical protein
MVHAINLNKYTTIYTCPKIIVINEALISPLPSEKKYKKKECDLWHKCANAKFPQNPY